MSLSLTNLDDTVDPALGELFAKIDLAPRRRTDKHCAFDGKVASSLMYINYYCLCYNVKHSFVVNPSRWQISEDWVH